MTLHGKFVVNDVCFLPLKRFGAGTFTLQHRSDFMAIRQALMSTRQTELPNGLMSYGMIEVILNGQASCGNGI